MMMAQQLVRSAVVAGARSVCGTAGAPGESVAVLRHRALVKVAGTDGLAMLNDLATADVLTTDSRPAQYSMFLNAQGRVLYDTIIYHIDKENILVECDNMAINQFTKHLKMYALRRKVSIDICTDLSVLTAAIGSQPHPSCVVAVPDPRLQSLGQRVIVPTSAVAAQCSHTVDGGDSGSCDHYHQIRFEMGVAEGMSEIPPGQLLPFELNLDYLQGVSFTKGCYIGQELTARTHHTGVVRKRLVPLRLQESYSSPILWGSSIVLHSGQKVGKVLSHLRSHLLGVVRLPDVDRHRQVCVQTGDGALLSAHWQRPQWWPTNSS